MFANSDGPIDWGFGVGVVLSGDGEIQTTINGGVGSKGSCPTCGLGSRQNNNLPMLILGVALVVLLLRK